jgi:hypothetical protein
MSQPTSLPACARRACAAVLGLLLAHGAAADEPSWNFSGFGTFGLVHANTRGADFTSSVMKASGAGHTRPWSADVDSRLGAQLDVTFDRRWSAVLQLLSEQHLDNSYKPEVEWANIKYQVAPDLALRLGRIALPMFLSADYRKIGYAYPSLRQPVEVYGALPLPRSDGADLTWRWSAGATRHATQVFYGRANIQLRDGARLKESALTGLSDSVEYGAFSARASVLTSVLTLTIARPLFDGLDAFSPSGGALSDRYDVDHKRATLFSLGASYDPGPWFVMAEGGRTRSNSYLGATTMAYASAGIRRGQLTPYLGYAMVRADVPIQDPGLPLAGLAPPRQLAGAGLNADLNALLRTIPVQSTVSAGLRWDLRSNAALSVQYDRVTPHGGSRGTFINSQPSISCSERRAWAYVHDASSRRRCSRCRSPRAAPPNWW